jgi:hypothetical protein
MDGVLRSSLSKPGGARLPHGSASVLEQPDAG